MTRLTRGQHEELAQLLNRAQDSLKRAMSIVSRAPYTDRYLYAAGTVQEWLIDPLREDWAEQDFHWDAPSFQVAPFLQHGPYQSIGYGGPHKRRTPPKTRCTPR